MKVERQQNVFGFLATLTVEVPAVATLSPGMAARLEHHVERGVQTVARRIAWHVIDWPKRRDVLRRMAKTDALALGLGREWEQAQTERDR